MGKRGRMVGLISYVTSSEESSIAAQQRTSVVRYQHRNTELRFNQLIAKYYRLPSLLQLHAFLIRSEYHCRFALRHDRQWRRQSSSCQQAAARDDAIDSRQPIDEGASATRQPQASRKGTVPVRSSRQCHQYVNTRVHALSLACIIP